MTTDPKNTTYPQNSSWKVQGRKFDSDNPDEPCDDQELTIPQTKLCVQLPGYEDMPLGRHIDANLAVHFISNFLKHIKTIYYPDPSPEFQEFLNDPKNEEFNSFVTKTRDFHRRVLELNYGMSIDKNILLKVLSQPDCEGVRFYLCFKPNDDPKKQKISLVMVGIDCEGRDLNYTFTSDTVTYYKGNEQGVIVPAKAGKKAIKNVVTQSSTGEYVTPPYTIVANSLFSEEECYKFHNGFDDKDDIEDYFVLLKLAKSGGDV